VYSEGHTNGREMEEKNNECAQYLTVSHEQTSGNPIDSHLGVDFIKLGLGVDHLHLWCRRVRDIVLADKWTASEQISAAHSDIDRSRPDSRLRPPATHLNSLAVDLTCSPTAPTVPTALAFPVVDLK
jgi:hypothetical protein